MNSDVSRLQTAEIRARIDACATKLTPGLDETWRGSYWALQTEVMCLFEMLPRSAYHMIGELAELDVDDADGRFVAAAINPEYLPPRRGEYLAWESPGDGIPDFVRLEYVAAGQHLSLAQTSDVVLLLVSADDLPVLRVPAAERRARLHDGIGRIVNPAYFRMRFSDLGVPYCVLPDNIVEGTSVGADPRWSGDGWCDPIFHVGIRRGRVYFFFYKEEPATYGSPVAPPRGARIASDRWFHREWEADQQP